MGSKEILSRRGFLKAAGIGAGGLVFGDYERKLNSYNDISADLENTSPNELANLIRVQNHNSLRIRSPEASGGYLKVEINKSRFAGALSFLASLDDSENGVARVKSFLSVRPLKIKLRSASPFPRAIRHGQIGEEQASYTPAMYVGGPYITISQDFLQRYYSFKKKKDMVNLALEEKLIPAELFKVVQDSRNPQQFIKTVANYNFREFLNWVGTKLGIDINSFNITEESYEGEIFDKFEDKLVSVMLGGNKASDYLGSFFSFQEV